MNQVPVWKVIVVVFTLLIAFWSLLPSMEYYSMPAADRRETPEIRDAKQRMTDADISVQDLSVKIEEARGVDSEALQALQTQLAAAKDGYDLAETDKKAAESELDDLRAEIIRLGLDLQGGVHLVLQVDRESALANYKDQIDRGLSEAQVMQQALDSAMTVVQRRIDEFGLSEPIIQMQPPDRIIVEAPGYDRPDEVASVLQTEAVLEFNMLGDLEEAHQIIDDIDDRTAVELTQLIKESGTTPEFMIADVNVNAVSTALNSEPAKALIPPEYKFMWSGEEDDETYGRYRKLYLVESRSVLTGKMLANAYMDVDTSRFNEPEVILFFNTKGSDILARVSENRLRDRMAIILDERIYLAPHFETRIPNGVARITGISDMQEATRLAIVLRAGALPAKLNIAENRVIGPSLGADSIRQGVYSAVAGIIIVAVFMVFYYGMAGAIADFALLLNFILVLAALAMFKATLTLPGVAGMVLLIGMAVDANVLIFERIREELGNQRSKTLKAVVEKGYNRAFLTIFDSNLTTLFTAIVLFQFGTGPIRGFAVTLMLGILISMFTALFVTRLVYDISLSKFNVQNLSMGKIRLLSGANWNFVDNARIPLAISGSIVVVGLIMAVVHGGLNAGIDFAGGSLLRVQFSDPVDENAIRQVLSDAGHPEGIIIQRLSDAEVAGTEFHLKTKLDSDGAGKQPVADKMVADLRAGFQNAGSGGAPITIETRSAEQVGASVGHQLAQQGFWCVIAGGLLILAYITVRFEFRFAVAAVAALVHDVLITISLFSILNWEFNLPIIAALLTIVGYSLNDTIVVFDRIRENYTSAILNMRDVVNKSINQSLSRTVITSATTFFVVLVMLIFGGAILRLFVAALCIGVIVGTYSSVFVAAPVLLAWKKKGRREAGPASARRPTAA